MARQILRAFHKNTVCGPNLNPQEKVVHIRISIYIVCVYALTLLCVSRKKAEEDIVNDLVGNSFSYSWGHEI